MIPGAIVTLALAWGLDVLVTVHPEAAEALILELRVFNGGEEVTSATRLIVHRAGERDQPVAQIQGSRAAIELSVAEGIYDVQAVQEQDGRVLNIRWANRLVVMPYPDEAGRHLEVINFKSGFGALQVRGRDTSPPEVYLHAPGRRDKPLAPIRGSRYALFVVPAGSYDLQLEAGAKSTWHEGVEVPLDRTRLWLPPEPD